MLATSPHRPAWRHTVLEIQFPARVVTVLARDLFVGEAVAMANAVGEGAFRIVYRADGKYYYGRSWTKLESGPWKLADDLADSFMKSSKRAT